jgi:hypothetical protein
MRTCRPPNRLQLGFRFDSGPARARFPKHSPDPLAQCHMVSLGQALDLSTDGVSKRRMNSLPPPGL